MGTLSDATSQISENYSLKSYKSTFSAWDSQLFLRLKLLYNVIRSPSKPNVSLMAFKIILLSNSFCALLIFALTPRDDSFVEKGPV